MVADSRRDAVLQVEPRSRIDHHIIELLAGNFQQLVDGLVRDMERGGQFTGRRQYE
jgi:hypothetical protein